MRRAVPHAFLALAALVALPATAQWPFSPDAPRPFREPVPFFTAVARLPVRARAPQAPAVPPSRAAHPPLAAALLGAARAMRRWRALRHSDGAQFHGEWFSEERGGLSRPFAYPIFGLRCSGGFCDRKLPLYVMPARKAPLRVARPNDQVGGAKLQWSMWLSDGEWHGRQRVAHCPRGTFVAQMQCLGPFCANMRLGCAGLRAGYRARYRRRKAEEDADDDLNATFSEEGDGVGYCPEAEYLDGIGCEGWFCDKIRLYCSRIEVLANRRW